MAHMVKCLYCEQMFNADKEEFVKPRTNRYAHKACYEKHENEKTQEEQDKEDLEDYIIETLGVPYITPRIQHQLKEMIEVRHYTYSGILGSLNYFYGIRGNSIERANQGIGIVPYIYDEARKYYSEIEMAHEINATRAQDYKIPTIELTIVSPKRDVMRHRRKQFTFLDS